MKKMASILALTMCMSACSTLHKGSSGIDYFSAQEKKLYAAIQLQKAGRTSAAAETLTALCAERGIPGITDEALFRLSLLTLKGNTGNGRDNLQPAQQVLERLRREYPYSSWTVMAAPVAEMLATTTELRRQNRGLKNQNQVLFRENQELKDNIEKLKRLDLEIERKIR